MCITKFFLPEEPLEPYLSHHDFFIIIKSFQLNVNINVIECTKYFYLG